MAVGDLTVLPSSHIGTVSSDEPVGGCDVVSSCGGGNPTYIDGSVTPLSSGGGCGIATRCIVIQLAVPLREAEVTLSADEDWSLVNALDMAGVRPIEQ